MIRFGVMGAGNITKKFSEAVNGIGGTLYAIASRDLQKAVTYQKTYGYEKAYDSYALMLNDPLVDCVYIATPHSLHYEYMMLALEYNKHILCEKAFTLNAKQAQAVFTKAREKNLFVMEALWTKFLPVILETQRLIKDGIIGEIEKVQATFCFKASHPDDSRLFAPHLGGGALLDIGIYPLTFSNLFLGTPKRIETTVEYYHTGVDLSAHLKLFYPKAYAQLEFSFGYEKPIEGYIYGTKGYIHVPMFIGAEKATIYSHQHEVIHEIVHKHWVNGMEYEVIAFLECVKNHLSECNLHPTNATLEMMHQMDEIRHQWDFVYPQEV